MTLRVLYQATRFWSAEVVSLVLVVTGAVLANLGANVINDYFDFVQGVDTKPEDGSGVLTCGLVTQQQALGCSVVLFGAAALCGVVFLRRDAANVVPLALIGFACAVLYPALLKKYALGDVLLSWPDLRLPAFSSANAGIESYDSSTLFSCDPCVFRSGQCGSGAARHGACGAGVCGRRARGF